MILKANKPFYLKETTFLDLARNTIEDKKNNIILPSNLRIIGQVGIIDIFGVLAERGDYCLTYSSIKEDLKIALENKQINIIILNFDSPGGDSFGTEDLASYIYHNKNIKPIVACVNNMAASAAYYIASACTRIFNASSVSETGSIGVVELHIDTSIQEKNIGVIITEIFIGKYKRIASLHKPLTDEGRQYREQQLTKIYNVFVNDVALYRNRDLQYTLEVMADGKEFLGDDAITAGLVDDVASLDELIYRYNGDDKMTIPFLNKAKSIEEPKKEEPKVQEPQEEPMVKALRAILTKDFFKPIIKEVLMEELPKIQEPEKEPTTQEPTQEPAPSVKKAKAEEPVVKPEEEPTEKEKQKSKLLKESVIPVKLPYETSCLNSTQNCVLKKITTVLNPKRSN